MTYREALEKERRWHKRALTIYLYHNLMLLKKKHWTIRDTAKKLEMSIGMISESIRLATAMIDNPELEKMKRKDALKLIK